MVDKKKIKKKSSKKKKQKEEKKVLICPVCGSRRIDYASLYPESGEIVGLGIPEKYYCPDCGYKGPVAIEVYEKEVKNARKQILKKRIARKKEAPRHVEILKPVFTVIILLFFITAFAMMIPHYKIKRTTPEAIGYNLGTSTELQEYQNTAVKTAAPPIITVDYENSSMKQISNAIGFPTLASILFPLFMIFFTAGFLVLMIYSHGKRLEMFS